MVDEPARWTANRASPCTPTKPRSLPLSDRLAYFWYVQPRSSTSGRSGSFTEAARRAQIIEAAIATVNELGFAQASLAQIARRAATSKSVISYHFDGKEELLEQVVHVVFSRAGELIIAAVGREVTWSAKLAAYVRAELSFIRDHRPSMMAANDILISHRSPDGVPLYLQGGDEETALLQSILRSGQAAGEFGRVDVTVAALTIVHAIDGALTQSQKDPATDLDAYADSLVPLLLRMVAPEGGA